MNDDTRSCLEVRTLLLEAEPHELLGEGQSSVARHVRACTACAELAQRMLGAQHELADALAHLGTHTTQLTHASTPTRTEAPATPARRTRRTLLRAAAPLAAAAVLALLLVPRGGEPPIAVPPELIAVASDVPVVNVPAGENVAVMQTTNPRITVIWYLNREKP